MVLVNVLYFVGAKNESPERTGMAHLFEHLMFGGSINIPDFDGELQRAGGGMGRIEELLAQDTRIQAPANPTVLPPRVRGELRLDKQ